MAVSVFSGDALTCFLSLCDEVSFSLLCSLTLVGSPICSGFCFKNKANCTKSSRPQPPNKHGVHFLCFGVVRRMFEKAKFLDGQADRLRRLVRLPESFHHPGVSLKASAVWTHQISQIRSTVWVKKRLKCVFSCDRWAYYLTVCVFSLWPININSLCLLPVHELCSELG